MSNYDDIIYMEHPVSKKHPQMSMENRAAQFSAFAALTGYGDAVEDTAKKNDAFMEKTGNDRELFFED